VKILVRLYSRPGKRYFVVVNSDNAFVKTSRKWPVPVCYICADRELHSFTLIDLRYGINHGHPTTAIPKIVRPSQRKGIQSTKTKFVRSIVREVAGFSPYERRVMELLRNSKVCLFLIPLHNRSILMHFAA